MMKSIGTLRDAIRSDLEPLAELLIAAALPLDGLRESFGANYAVLTVEGSVAGAAGIELYGDYALLRSVVVDSTVRGTGWGEQLVRNRLAWAQENGAKAALLLTTTAESYFHRLGFQKIRRELVPLEIRESVEFRSACPQSAAVMQFVFEGGTGSNSDKERTKVEDRMKEVNVKDVVKEKYGNAALRVMKGQTNSCCGATDGIGRGCDPITSNLYDAIQAGQIPEQAMLASLGCGNPTALAQLNPGEVVLDLGSGGGIDVLLSAKRVGPTGKAYGLDMTDEMLALANENKRNAGADNVEFLKGEIEHIPLPDNSVDVIISNCVINLSADKDQVLREAFRVLKPGGRFAVSDVVTKGEIVPEVRQSILLWVGCVAGAMQDVEYRAKLEAAGFSQVDIEPTRVYRVDDAREMLSEAGIDVDAIAPQVDGKFMSAFVRAVKPATKACCGPTCCN